ncbi:type II toxin-antitoxin system VapC family toxin [Klenkia sp. LSe6-5]|uniref:Type II toxin-antitoxin system VapC family toxin n=1 Tax=Klenkia sesuvii TaxID=3103137 RepID=A0ABU8DSY3_9ACTN
MAFLLDTSALLWVLGDDPRLGPRTRSAMVDGADSVVSVVSSWEIVIKSTVGKLRPVPRLPAVLEERGIRRLAIEDRHLLALAELPLVHRDPFDRLLLAQAQVEGLTVITSDAVFAQYDVPVLDARS